MRLLFLLLFLATIPCPAQDGPRYGLIETAELSDVERAEMQADALHAAEEGRDRDAGRLHRTLAKDAQRRASYAEATQHYTTSVDHLRAADALDEVVEVQHELASLFFDLGDFARSRDGYQAVLDLGPDLVGTEVRLRCLGNQAKCLYYLAELDAALELVDGYVEEARAAELPFFLADGLMTRASCLSDLGIYGPAFETAQEAAEVFLAIDNPQGARVARQIGAKIHLQLEDHPTGIAILRELLTEIDAESDPMMFAFVSTDVGTALVDSGNLEEARPHLEAALEASRAIGQPFVEVRVRGRLARLHLAAGRVQEALDHAEAGEALALEHQAPILTEDLPIALAWGDHHRGDPDAAYDRLRVARELFVQTEELSPQIGIEEAELAIREANQDWSGALAVARRLDQLRIQHLTTEQARKVKELEYTFDLKQRDLERDQLLAQRTRDEVTIRDQRRLVMVITGAGVVAAVLVLALALSRRRLEEQRSLAQDLRQQADDANAAKSAFLANMSHEIRTPLHVIQGYAQLLAHREHQDPADRAGLQAIVRSGDHLMNIVNDVLELSSIEAGRFEERREPYSPEQLLREVREMFRLAAHDRGVSLSADCGLDVPARLIGDPGKVRQILINLVHNALRHDAQGEVTVTASLEQDELVFQVRDRGPGLSAEDLERVFGRFEHGRGAQVGGTGLGLAISRQVAEGLGGSLTAASEPGRGTTFRLTLPARTTRDGDAADEGVIEHLALADGSAPRVLIVEDHQEHQEVLALALERVGVTSSWAVDLATARDALANPPDAVLLDLRLGDEDGLDLLRHGHAVPPTIVVSAEALNEARAEPLVAGAAAFLSKPIDEQSLFQALADALDLGVERSYDLERPDDDELIAAQVARAEATLRKEVLRAADHADRARLQELAGTLREEHPEAAAALERHASAFEYERIQELFG